LIPILIYDGNDEIFCTEIKKYDCNIIKHQTLLYNKPNFKNMNNEQKNIACGAFLRLDIPIICDINNINDNFVLYTDTDVIFLQDIVSELEQYKPKYFSICPEFDKNNYMEFNSGVMLINVKSMQLSYEEFTNFMELNNYMFDAFDQGALREFYKNKTDNLPLYFNHKPYWGLSDDAQIIHYHGPKYGFIINYFNNIIIDAYKPLFDMQNYNIWKYYQYLYEAYAQNFDWKYYLATYEDLQNAGLKTEYDVILHWNNYGKNENRIYKKI